MKNFPLLIAVVFTIFASCSQEQNSRDHSPLAEFADSLFQRNTDSSNIAGASVLVFRDGDKLLDQNYGYASLELSTPMPEHPVFEIGSVTKQFTAAAILRLAEEGKLSLDDDFTRYLDFDPRGRKITIRQLLDHTSGIASYTGIPEFSSLSIEKHDRDTVVRLVEQKDFLFEPGEMMLYNNSGYFFLGLIIEEVSGKSYTDYLEEQFFQPLEMHNTYYSSNSEIIPNKVYGYRYTRDGLKQKRYLDHTWPYAAGSLSSTTDDLATWMRALHDGKVFNDEQYRTMISPGTLNNGARLRYAMGLANYSMYGHQVIAHGGGINGFLSDTRYFPDENLYMICLVNTTGPKGAGVFADQLTWELLDKKKPQSVEPDTSLESIEGKYSGQVNGRKVSLEVTTLDEAIVLSAKGQKNPDTLKVHIGDNRWMDGKTIIEFANDELRRDDVNSYIILEKVK